MEREREKKIEKEGKRLQRIVLLLTTKKKSAFAILCFILEAMDKGNIHFNFQFFQVSKCFFEKVMSFQLLLHPLFMLDFSTFFTTTIILSCTEIVIIYIVRLLSFYEAYCVLLFIMFYEL